MLKIPKILIFLILANSKIFAQDPLINSLTNYWPFDNNSYDMVANNHGEIYGDVSPITGKDENVESAYYFDGDNDYIKILSPDFSETTIAFWIKPDGVINDMRILSNTDGGDSSFATRFQDNNIEIWSTSAWKPLISFDPSIQDKWTFISFTIDSNKNVVGYLNGIPYNNQSISFQWSNYLGIGSKFLLSHGFDYKGAVDELMIFNKVLSQEEIQSLYTNGIPEFSDPIHIKNGKVGIKTSNPDMELTVLGKIHAEEVKIDLNVPAPDYVFDKGYNLRSIDELENYIKQNRHLPEVLSAEEFKEYGIMQGEMDMLLLKKIEELTLYIIEQEHKIRFLKKEIKQLKEN